MYPVNSSNIYNKKKIIEIGIEIFQDVHFSCKVCFGAKKIRSRTL